VNEHQISAVKDKYYRFEQSPMRVETQAELWDWAVVVLRAAKTQFSAAYMASSGSIP